MSSIVNHLFYTFKPIIPRAVQIGLRRQIARYKRNKYVHVWPIDPHSATPPKDWRGWPGGKQFALVLSHDVDTRKGYDNVLKLAELEEQMGFRSCFNFVPERYGKVSPEVLEELRLRGFDVAVHGLKHDGKLFRSKRVFDRSAKRINAYLAEWKTEGFTSPSMQHNLDWLIGLNIKYSISTFDTDPFEPQPDGVGTIFPFWVPNCSPSHGFVEMPYTLPQDSTLFIILEEKTIDIWKRKLVWVAQHGGMVLLNTHPDYMNFSNGDSGELCYPSEYYVRFLDFIKTRYSGRFYHALPSIIAGFIEDNCPGLSSLLIMPKNHVEEPTQAEHSVPASPSQAPRFLSRALRVAMLTYSFYESDNRVRRYAETLVKQGHSVDVISLRREKQEKYNELKGVRIYRVQERTRDEKGKFKYLSKILKFFIKSTIFLTRNHVRNRYDLIHIHSVPDFEVFAALAPKITGAKIILDIHDIVPELYASKFSAGKQSIMFKILLVVEKAAIAFSNHVIISNDLWRNTLISRSVGNEKCTSILNYPDDELFRHMERGKANEKTVLLYPGTFNHHQGLDIAIKAFAKIKAMVPEAEFHIYGDGLTQAELMRLIADLSLNDCIFMNGPVALDEIPEIMANADIGVIPKRNDDFGGEAFSTKTLEFMSMGVPIIVARTKIDQYYFNDSIVKFFEPGNEDDLARAMLEMIQNKKMRKAFSRNASKFMEDFSWKNRKQKYLDLVDCLTQVH
jgi:glycosyltransferase involved in cell wall biosynthesis